MCRFAAYLGPEITLDELITRPSHSLIHQSFKSEEREEPLNGDGFGVAWYAHGVSTEPGRYRSVSPAWNSQNLQHIARVTRTTCTFAHIRAASPGLGVTETNCHPFLMGHLAFMHNGYIPQFAMVRRALLQRLSDQSFHKIYGTTDSEHMFGVFADHLRNEGSSGIVEMAAALRRTLEDVDKLLAEFGVNEASQLNLAVTDGHRMVVSRFSGGSRDEPPNSLHVRTVDDSVLIASEALNDEPGWRDVPEDHLVIVDSDRSVHIEAL